MFTVVKLDKSRNILMGFKALQTFKKLTGKSLIKMDYENEDMEDYLPQLFYCGLLHEDKEITLDKTIELIDIHLGVKGAMEILPEIIENTFGKEDKEEGKNVQRAMK